MKYKCLNGVDCNFYEWEVRKEDAKQIRCPNCHSRCVVELSLFQKAVDGAKARIEEFPAPPTIGGLLEDVDVLVQLLRKAPKGPTYGTALASEIVRQARE